MSTPVTNQFHQSQYFKFDQFKKLVDSIRHDKITEDKDIKEELPRLLGNKRNIIQEIWSRCIHQLKSLFSKSYKNKFTQAVQKVNNVWTQTQKEITERQEREVQAKKEDKAARTITKFFRNAKLKKLKVKVENSYKSVVDSNKKLRKEIEIKNKNLNEYNTLIDLKKAQLKTVEAKKNEYIKIKDKTFFTFLSSDVKNAKKVYEDTVKQLKETQNQIEEVKKKFTSLENFEDDLPEFIKILRTQESIHKANLEEEKILAKVVQALNADEITPSTDIELSDSDVEEIDEIPEVQEIKTPYNEMLEDLKKAHSKAPEMFDALFSVLNNQETLFEKVNENHYKLNQKVKIWVPTINGKGAVFIFDQLEIKMTQNNIELINVENYTHIGFGMGVGITNLFQMKFFGDNVSFQGGVKVKVFGMKTKWVDFPIDMVLNNWKQAKLSPENHEKFYKAQQK